MKRRNFVKLAGIGVVAAGANVSTLAQTANKSVNTEKAASDSASKIVAPSDRIRIGVIGAGSRGQEVMRYFLRMPGVEVSALCDVYEPRFAEARKVTKQETPVFRDYRRMFDAKDLNLDAVIVATPLSLHAEHNIAALERGLHVYGEKSFGFTVDDCNNTVKAVARSGKHFQIGHQYHYDPAYTEALKRIHAGEIGRVTHVYGYWHRNGNWRRSVPDPKFERLINWRMYREYSGGLMAELGGHQIDLANQIYEAMPESVMGSGGIDTYKDGRETDDNVQAVFRYPQGRTMMFSALTDNAKVGYQLTAYGDKGSVEFSYDGVLFYYEPQPASAPAAKNEIIERGVVTGATYSVKGERPYRGPGAPVKILEGAEGNANFVAVRSFIQSLRENRRPVADEHAGYASAVSVALANKAIQEERRIHFVEHLHKSQTRD